MAKAIATIAGTALRPGVSRNKRWYTKEAIAKAVTRAQQRIAAGERPMVMLTVHPDGPIDSAGISASLTGMSLDEAGNARFTASIADTSAGRDMASLADTSDGQVPHLKNVSIRGNWLGTVRRVKGPEGGIVETGDDLELDGLEFTPAPGVTGAQIDTFAWAGSDSQTETDERVFITESVEAAVTFADTTENGTGQENPPAVPLSAQEALRLVLGDPAACHVAEADSATPAMSKRKSGLTGSGRQWADPGYQSDKRQRYDITTKAKALTAWRYIHQQSKAAKYSSAQLKQIRARIRAALKRFGVKAASTSDEATPYWGFTESAVDGWSLSAFQVGEELAEYFGDPSRAGSWCVTASNGEVSITMSSYCMNPADLDPVLRKATDGVCGALKTLDPDMDGDVDVPGTSGDTDDDSGDETAPDEDDPATETEPDDAGEDPAPAGTQETEDPAMAEDTHEAGGAAPAGLTPDMLKAISEATAATVTAAFEARDAAKEKAKRDAKEAAEKEAREAAARKTALTEALAELGIKIPAPAAEGTPSTESGDGNAPLTEADVEKRVSDAVAEALVEFKQGLITSGAILPARAGLVVREHAVPDADNAPDGEALRKMSDEDLGNYLGGAMAQQADLIRPVGAG